MGGPFCATDTIHDSYECVTEGRTKARLAPGVKTSVYGASKELLETGIPLSKEQCVIIAIFLILILVKIGPEIFITIFSAVFCF